MATADPPTPSPGGTDTDTDADDPPWRDAHVLRALYRGCDLTVPEVANVLGCAPETVRRWLNRTGLGTRGECGHGYAGPWRDRATLRALCIERGMTDAEAAARLRCSAQTVYRWRHRLGVDRADAEAPDDGDDG